jgi:hypothetical protein
MGQIRTTKGMVDSSLMQRTVGFEERVYPDREGEFVVWVEWRLGEEIVRRDAHVIVKDPSVVADAIAAGVG